MAQNYTISAIFDLAFAQCEGKGKDFFIILT